MVSIVNKVLGDPKTEVLKTMAKNVKIKEHPILVFFFLIKKQKRRKLWKK